MALTFSPNKSTPPLPFGGILGQTKPRLKKIAVLVIDDEPMIRELLADWLGGEWNLDVVEAENYEQAEMIVQGEPDLWIVLCDYYIRVGQQGQHFATTAVSFYRRCMPVLEERNGTFVLMTGGNMPSSDEQFFSAQKVPRIEKPWANTDVDVVPHIAEAIRKHWTREQLEAGLLPILFRAVLANPEPITPEEAALEDQWRSPDAWKQLLPKPEGEN